MTRRPFVLLVLLLGCRPAGETEGRPPTGDTAVRDDLRMLCERLEADAISAWSQPTYRSRKVRDITIAMDQNDDEASCKLALLMKKHRLPECRDAQDDLSLRCDI